MLFYIPSAIITFLVISERLFVYLKKSPRFSPKWRLNRNFWASEAILEGKYCSYGFHHGGWIFRGWYELLISHKIFTLRCTQQVNLSTCSCVKNRKISCSNKCNFSKKCLKNLSQSLNYFFMLKFKQIRYFLIP